jgi:hypothetical protein
MPLKNDCIVIFQKSKINFSFSNKPTVPAGGAAQWSQLKV